MGIQGSGEGLVNHLQLLGNCVAQSEVKPETKTYISEHSFEIQSEHSTTGELAEMGEFKEGKSAGTE